MTEDLFHNFPMGRPRTHHKMILHHHHQDFAELIDWQELFRLTIYPLSYLIMNFHPLEMVSRCRDPQLQAGEN